MNAPNMSGSTMRDKKSPFRIIEKDSSGRIIATYIESQLQLQSPTTQPTNQHGAAPQTRLDIIRETSRSQKGIPYLQTLTTYLTNAFLPIGYPHTTSPDYTPYQIYDSFQAFSSSIANLLSSRAVLQGVGVGDASASPTAALLLSVLQDSIGRMATILFASRFGTALEPECKMWRLAADIFNDLAMVLDCLSPVFPAGFLRVSVLAGSASLRALCGVAAGSAKASLSNHFAIAQNLGEVSAKDSSQETVISLTGMIAGTVVVKWATGPLETWSLLIVLLICHLGCNYLAVRSVEMDCLNRQRASLVFHCLQDGVVPTLSHISRMERVFERDGVLRGKDGSVIGRARVGVSLAMMTRNMGVRQASTGATTQISTSISDLLALYRNEDFVLWFDRSSSKAFIVLKDGCSPRAQIKAWWLALLVASNQKGEGHAGPQSEKLELRHADIATSQNPDLRLLSRSLRQLTSVSDQWIRDLEARGWDLNIPAIETTSGTRVTIDDID